MEKIYAFNIMITGGYVYINDRQTFTDLEIGNNLFTIHSCEQDCLNVYHAETEQVFYDIPYSHITTFLTNI